MTAPASACPRRFSSSEVGAADWRFAGLSRELPSGELFICCGAHSAWQQVGFRAAREDAASPRRKLSKVHDIGLNLFNELRVDIAGSLQSV